MLPYAGTSDEAHESDPRAWHAMSSPAQPRPTNASTPSRASLDARHVTRYSQIMIRTFADKQAEQFWVTGRIRRLPPDIARRALRKLSAIEAAAEVEVLRVPPGNRLHPLEGDRAGQHSISVNGQWRICFRFEDGDAYDVEICDYH